MKTLRTIQEGFYRNTSSGIDSVIKGLGLEDGSYEVDDKGDIKIIKNKFTISNFSGKSIPVEITSGVSGISNIVLNIKDCPNLESIENVKVFGISVLNIDNCPNIKSLRGPFFIHGSDLLIRNNNHLRDMSSLNYKIFNEIFCVNCTQLTSLNGVEEVLRSITITKCTKFRELGKSIKKIGFGSKQFNNLTKLGELIGIPKCNYVFLLDIPKYFDYDITKYTKWDKDTLFSCNNTTTPEEAVQNKRFRWNIKKNQKL